MNPKLMTQHDVTVLALVWQRMHGPACTDTVCAHHQCSTCWHHMQAPHAGTTSAAGPAGCPPEQPVHLARHCLHSLVGRLVLLRRLQPVGWVGRCVDACAGHPGAQGGALARPGRAAAAVVCVDVAREQRDGGHLLLCWRLEGVGPERGGRAEVKAQVLLVRCRGTSMARWWLCVAWGHTVLLTSASQDQHAAATAQLPCCVPGNCCFYRQQSTQLWPPLLHQMLTGWRVRQVLLWPPQWPGP